MEKKDLEEREVKWMFKGWNLLRTGWGPLEGQMGEASVRLHEYWAPGYPMLYPVYLSLCLEGNQNISSFGQKRGRRNHGGLNLFSLLLLLMVHGQLSISPLSYGTYIIYDGE